MILRDRLQRPLRVLSVVALTLCCVAARAWAVPPAPNRKTVTVDAVEITVGDLDRSIAFFRDVLSFTPVGDAGNQESSGAAREQLLGVFGAHVRSARLMLGQESIVLTEYLAPRGRPVPNDVHSNDLTFQHIAIVVSDMDRAYQHLRKNRVAHVSSEPQTLPLSNPAAGGIKAFYFSDPDDHTLELIWFPPGKGDPRWQLPRASQGSASPPLFLGIDHTAIAVADSERSLRFYQDTFGMRVAGTSDNKGTEQEHLNNVFGAHLRITGLRGLAGPGVEFLEYVSPRDGRPAPRDLHANDLSHWQTIVRTGDLSVARARALVSGGSAVSPAIVDITDRALHLKRAAMVRDPDGHAVLIAD